MRRIITAVGIGLLATALTAGVAGAATATAYDGPCYGPYDGPYSGGPYGDPHYGGARPSDGYYDANGTYWYWDPYADSYLACPSACSGRLT